MRTYITTTILIVIVHERSVDPGGGGGGARTHTRAQARAHTYTRRWKNTYCKRVVFYASRTKKGRSVVKKIKMVGSIEEGIVVDGTAVLAEPLLQ